MRNEFRETLQNSGVEMDETLARFMNDEEIYERFLRKFLGDQNYSKLVQYYQHNDWEQAFRAAHTLKGVTANLGMVRINKILCELVEELRTNEKSDRSQQLFQQFCVEFESLMETIRKELT